MILQSAEAPFHAPGGLAVCFNASFMGFSAHAGFLQGLHDLGIRPEAVSGASSGAFVAGLYAAGMQAHAIWEILQGGVLTRTFLEPRIISRGLALTLCRGGITGMVRGDRTKELIEKYIGGKNIEECVHPRLALSVTNLSRARSEIVRTGSMAEWIVASCAFPVLCAAREINGDHYLDGGVANAAPIDPWIDDPAIQTMIVHEIATRSELASRSPGRKLSVSDACSISHQTICEELFRAKRTLAEKSGKRLVVVRTNSPFPSLLSKKAKLACFEAGRSSALSQLKLLREGTGNTSLK